MSCSERGLVDFSDFEGNLSEHKALLALEHLRNAVALVERGKCNPKRSGLKPSELIELAVPVLIKYRLISDEVIELRDRYLSSCLHRKRALIRFNKRTHTEKLRQYYQSA
jgi:hypothetical protein